MLLLVASVAGNALLYRKASRPLFEEADRPLIECTIARAAARSQHVDADDIRSHSFPIVMRRGFQTCIELRRYDRRGYIGGCYDRQGRLIEETAGVSG
ncbi:MAG: hypothetical protein QOJ91_1553 [Sphingomonadales bacterium]|nr:hypothetical protein [Sphingomonadales bacterium]